MPKGQWGPQPPAAGTVMVVTMTAREATASTKTLIVVAMALDASLAATW